MPIAMQNKIREWVEKYRLPKEANPSNATHLCLANAKYAIPREKEREWLRLYAMELEQNPRSLFIVEHRTAIFRMHFDLDIIQPTEASEDDIITFVRLFCGVFRSFYPDTPADDKSFTCIVLSAPTIPKKGVLRPNDIVSDMVIKSGFHLIWPYLRVSQDQALQLREACVAASNQYLPAREPPMNSYSDMIDEAVLLKNGFRMMGSDKRAKCDACKGSGNNLQFGGACTKCAGEGKFDERRVYLPKMIIGSNGEKDTVRFNIINDPDNLVKCVRLCSIRSCYDLPTPGFKPPPLAPPSASLDKLRRERKKQRKNNNNNSVSSSASVVPGSSADSGFESAYQIGINTHLARLIEEFIQNRMGEQWSELKVKGLFLKRSDSCCLVKVDGIGASYCSNVNRAHSSSTIYFVINTSGISQRCYSKKEGVAGSLPCRKYKGVPVPLSAVLYQSLFNDHSNDQQRSEITKRMMKGHVFENKLQHLHSAQQMAAEVRAEREKECANERELINNLSGHKRAQERICESIRKKSKKCKSAADQPHPILSDMTCKEVESLGLLDLCNLDREHVENAKKIARQVREECFNGAVPLVESKGGKKTKKKKL